MPDVVAAFDAFIPEHRRCGDIDSGVDDQHVWLECDCGARITRPLVLPAIDPMQSTEVTQSFDRAGWVYEEKYDGWRMVAYKDGTAVRLVSRAGKDPGRTS